MRALQITDHSTPPAIAEVVRPDPAPGQVLVKIAACGLNFADLLMANGTYQEIPPLPAIPGMELAGVIEELGANVDTLAVGDRIAVFAGHGGLAEYGAFDAARAIPIPDAMPFEHAAGFIVAYGTSHLALSHRARLQPGETLLVLGAAGGVGLTAVEIGARMGARVVAAARGGDKLAVARAAGAEHLIDTGTDDLLARVKELGGCDVVFDPVGGSLTKAALRGCRPEARLLVVGFASGDVPQLAANHLLVKNTIVHGFYWGGYMAFAPDRVTASLAALLDLYEAGALHPHVSHALPLSRVLEGMELLRSRRSTGKVVVTMDG